MKPAGLFIALFVIFLSCNESLAQTFPKTKPVAIIVPVNYTPRIKFGIEKLASALEKRGHRVMVGRLFKYEKDLLYIQVYRSDDSIVRKIHPALKKTGKEGFSVVSVPSNNSLLVTGADDSGILYGCLELAERVQSAGLPVNIDITDQPGMVLRGACIGVQKPYYLPGRTVYEYPYTPETFPWFYNKKLWIQYLDSMVANRMNSLYLWNGHPFASLVRTKEYPYAVEVDEATFKKNEEIYGFLTAEADKRGIWVIQMFYNIIVSKPFAEKHNIKTQDRERPIMPLISDYTRKSIAAFVEKYPNVGLMVCLGEAMEGVGHDDVEWFTKTIIPGVQDGLKALGKTEEPPIVLRAHDTDAPTVMKAALPLYKNLYTEAKFNGEALTTYEPRGKWAELHQTLSRIGSVQIENVHILANLEPFRYGSAEFIQKSVQGMKKIMEGNGLHLYPQASYWDWPYSADNADGKRLLQVERDWIWYAAWSRYAWNADRDRNKEIEYWSARLAAKYGCAPAQGRSILEAYEQSGEVAPKILRRFGITDGNRQTMTLGMLMTQLINPYRYGLFTLLYESESPIGEMLIEYAEKEWKKQPHVGETPPQIIHEIKAHGDKAVEAIDAAAAFIKKDKAEFNRLRNDMYCYQAMAYHYAFKTEAAIHVLRYKYSNDIADLEKALPLLQKSMEWYQKLVQLTQHSYLYANSMQTQQRKIPIRGVDGTFKTWKEVAVPFEAELKHFTRAIDSLKQNKGNASIGTIALERAHGVQGIDTKHYTLDSASRPFSDTSLHIVAVARELKGLNGLQFSFSDQVVNGTSIKFSSNEPVKVLVGYFASGTPQLAKAPELETNAAANDYGQAEIKIANGVIIKGMPPINVHSYSLPAGMNTLKLPKGACLVLGFVNGKQAIPVYDAGLTERGIKKEIDWLFE